MIKIIAPLVLSIALFGCQSTKFNKSVIDSSGYTVDSAVLNKYSDLVVTDELEGNFYYTGSDYDDWILGSSYRIVKFTYHPDSKEKVITADVRTMQEDWIHADSVSIFVGKDKIVDKWRDGKYTNTSIVSGGSLPDTVYTHEHFKIKLSIQDAKKIANAEPSAITLRFYGEQGYVDEDLNMAFSWSNISGVVKLAEATRIKE